MKRYKKEIVAVILLIVMMIVCSMSYAYAMSAPVPSVVITSENVSFEEKVPGSWQVEKSAKWISKGKARVTFDIDTMLMSNEEASDIIFVVDTSGSMEGDKLNQVKIDSINLINDVLSNTNNHVALIEFNSEAMIHTDFTNDKDLLINEINSLDVSNSTSYYNAFLKVDELLQGYQKQDGREVVMMFLTDGYPWEGNPNQVTQYKYLKEAYPYLTINAIQYEMGDTIIEPLKEVSDNQYIAYQDNLGEVLEEASITAIPYEKFQIIDYIDNEYYTLNSVDDIKVSNGEVKLEEENGIQKITWIIDNYLSGRKAKLTMDLSLKDEYIGEGGVYPTNQKEEVISSIENQYEDVNSNLTPTLMEKYQVIYDGNAPEGSSVENIPDSEAQSVFDTVEITEEKPTCTGYIFQGWEIITDGVKKLGSDYFVMPEENVVLRAKWSKIELAKSMDGVVSEQGDPIMKGYSINSTEDFNSSEYKSKITRIVTKADTDIPDTAIESWDISLAGDWSVVGYVEDDGSGNDTYQLTLGGRGGIILSNASYLFRGFTSLVSLDLTHLDTSRCTTMYAMFQFSSRIENLDLRSFNTSNVTDMAFMFSNCGSLKSINLSGFDTSNVLSMMNMFNSCTITELDVSSFNTSSVTSMAGMFSGCSNLTSLDLSDFNTSSVSVMANMFQGCSRLVNLDIHSFNTSNVTNMSSMFSQCGSLLELDVSRFDTSKVANMSSMFYQCSGLSELVVSNFNTSRVTNMSYMFFQCTGLTSLDLSSFDTRLVTNFNGMFQRCLYLLYLDFRNAEFNAESYANMFEVPSSIQILVKDEIAKSWIEDKLNGRGEVIVA